MCRGVQGGAFELVTVLVPATPSLPSPYERGQLSVGGIAIRVMTHPPRTGEVAVDLCIAAEVRALNEAGVRTLCACCGGHEHEPLVKVGDGAGGGILIHADDAAKVATLGYTEQPCRYGPEPHHGYPPHVEVAPIGADSYIEVST